MLDRANADTSDREMVIRWIRRHARPLTTLDPQAPLTDLHPLGDMARHAKVVGLGGSTRGAHELSVVKHRILRFLVEELGFRSLALEEDWTKGIQIDEYLQTGRGDPRALLMNAWLPWRTEEILDVVRWMRSYNQQHPDDPLRFVGVDIGAVRALAYDAVVDYVRRTAPQRLDELETHYAVLRPAGGIDEHIQRYRSQQEKQPFIDHAWLAYDLVNSLPAHHGHALALRHARAVAGFYEYHAHGSIGYAEQRLGENTIWWHEHTAHKVVYWGGNAHTRADRNLCSGPALPGTWRSAGSYLRDHFGPGYMSIGLTFHHGSVPYPVPAPPPEFADSVLGSAGIDTYFLDLHTRQPHVVRTWLNAPAKMRLIGPRYNPEDDRASQMAGGSLADWFDGIVHIQEATPTRFLA